MESRSRVNGAVPIHSMKIGRVLFVLAAVVAGGSATMWQWEGHLHPTRVSEPIAGNGIILTASATQAPNGQQPSASPPSSSGGGGGVPTQAAKFSVSGSASGAYPGGNLPLPLTVTNQYPFAITVTSISIQVGNATSNCPAANLTPMNFTGSLAVPANGTASVTLGVMMVSGAPNACQGVTFPLTYTATAVKP
jgi:hypothetical protein